MSVDDGLDDEMERLAADAEARSLEDRVAELVKTVAVPCEVDPGRPAGVSTGGSLRNNL